MLQSESEEEARNGALEIVGAGWVILELKPLLLRRAVPATRSRYHARGTISSLRQWQRRICLFSRWMCRRTRLSSS